MPKVIDEKTKLSKSEFFLRTLMEEQAQEENYICKMGGTVSPYRSGETSLLSKEKVIVRRTIEKWKEAKEFGLDIDDF